MLWFHELFETLLKAKYAKIEDYPLYQELIQFSEKAGDYKQVEPDKNNKKPDREVIEESDKMNMTADEVFAFYLYKTSRKINDQFYKTILAFVIFFREFLNEIGWKKLMESEEALLEEQIDTEEEYKDEFCCVNSAELAPDICNEFVTIYMDLDQNRSLMEISKHDKIDLTINLCNWLF